MELYLSWVYSLRYFNQTDFMNDLKINIFSLNIILHKLEQIDFLEHLKKLEIPQKQQEELLNLITQKKLKQD